LAGRAAAGTAAMITSSPLRELLGPRGRSSLRHHLALMRERGTVAVHALIVLGDGHQSLLAGVVEDVLRRAGAVVHEAARDPGGDDGVPLAVHGAASASCWSVQSLSGPEGASEVRVTACGPLREFDDTRAAATAVLCGRAARDRADAASPARRPRLRSRSRSTLRRCPRGARPAPARERAAVGTGSDDEV